MCAVLENLREGRVAKEEKEGCVCVMAQRIIEHGHYLAFSPSFEK